MYNIKIMEKPPQSLEQEVIPKTPEELKLDEARAKYAEAYKAFLAERKGERKGLQKLSTAKEYVFGATIKEEDTSEELKQLEREYDQAAVACGNEMFEAKKKELEGSAFSVEKKEEELKRYKQNEIFTRVIVEEQSRLNGLQVENLPPKEKGVIRKSLEWYLGLKPAWKKVAISTLLSTGAIVLLSSGTIMTVGTVAAIAGGRAVRATAGSLTGQGIAKIYNHFFQEKPAEVREAEEKELAETFGDENLDTDLSTTKKEYTQIMERERKAKKNQLITRAMITMAAGIGTSYGMGHVLDNTPDKLDTSGHGVDKNSGSIFDKPKSDPLFDFGKPKTGSIFDQNTPEHTPALTSEIFHNEGITFDHGKGGIQGILDLKAQIKSQYLDISKAPQSVQDFMNTDATKEAIKLGLYDPNNTNESALIREGLVLKFDEHGNLLFGKPDASGHIPVLEKTNLKMIDTDKGAPEPIIPPKPTAEELKAILEAKYPKAVPTPDASIPHVPEMFKELFDPKTGKVVEYQGPAEGNTEHGEVLPIPSGKDNLLLQSHPEFVIKNPFGLSGAQLLKTFEIHQKNINYILPHDTTENWSDVGQLKAKDFLKADAIEQGRNMGPIVSYMQRLRAESGLKPEGGLFGIGGEKTEHYMARALQKIEAEGHLHKVILHTEVPKSPDMQGAQQTIQEEVKNIVQPITPEPTKPVDYRHPSIPEVDESGKPIASEPTHVEPEVKAQVVEPAQVNASARVETASIPSGTLTSFETLHDIPNGESTKIGGLEMTRIGTNYNFTNPTNETTFSMIFNKVGNSLNGQNRIGFEDGGKIMELDKAIPLKQLILDNLPDKQSSLAQDLLKEIAKNKEELEFLKEFKK